jgi:hypothetical protein
MGKSIALKRSCKYDRRAEARKVVLGDNGPSKVVANSVALSRTLPCIRLGLPFRCLN